MKNWSIRKKILLGHGVSLLLTMIVLVWAFINLLKLGKASDNILRENYKSILAAGNMYEAIARQDNAILLSMIDPTDDVLQQFYQSENLFLQWLVKAKDNITVEGEAKIIHAIEKEYTYYLAQFSELRLISRTEKKNLTEFYYEHILPSYIIIRDTCIQLRDINQKTMFDASEKARRLAATSMWSLLTIGMMAVGIGLGFSLLLSTIIVRPLKNMMIATQKIANKNYETEIAVESTDELGLLARDFNTMVRKIKAYQDLNIQQKILEQKKNEAILQNMDDGIVVVDNEFKITNINPRATKILGTEESKCLHRHFLEIFKSEKLFKYVRQAVDSGEIPRIDEGKNVFSIQSEHGVTYYDFSVTPIPIRKSENLFHAVLLLRDITRLKELDRLKSEFVMAASHELRTPLTGIHMSIRLLRESAENKLSQKEKELIAAADEEAQRLKGLVNDLLDLSKIEAGKMDMNFQNVSITDIVEKAVIILKSQTEEKGVALSYQIDEQMAPVKADADKVTWVLTNLIANALRFTEERGFIKLTVKKVGAFIHIAVQDNGAGIPFEYQSKIFDKFVRVQDKMNEGGTGLGLTICREIIRAHGGTIWLDSTPGNGSTFTFTLPII